MNRDAISERKTGPAAAMATAVCAAGLLGVIATAGVARADSFERRGRWLPRSDALVGALKARPREFIDRRGLTAGARAKVALGAVLFRAPGLLGLEARRISMSCQTCHSGGHVNRGFFIPGLSAKNGTVDLTSGAFHRPADDGRFNPLRIPSLRGARRSAPYGRRGAFPTLQAFARHVIVDEFGGAAPSPAVLNALAAYVAALKPAPNRFLRTNGRLTGAASAAARRGEALFLRPFKPGGEQACASCHIPARGFADGRRHDVGTGGAVDTPSLRGGAVGPYMHDGRYDRHDQVVTYFTRQFAIAWDAGQKADLVAYLQAVGAAQSGVEPVKLAGDLEQVDQGEQVLNGVLRRKQNALLALVVPTLRRDLGRIHDRFRDPGHGLARQALVAWSRGLQAVRSAAEAGDHARARGILLSLRAARVRWVKVLAAASETSLYDPARLDGFLAVRRRKVR